MNFICEHWEALSSLLLSVVAIGIAIYSSRQTSKDATRQIAAIKDLCRLQIETSLKQLEIELDKAQLKVQQGKLENEYVEEAFHGSMSHMMYVKEKAIKDFPLHKAQNDYNFYCAYEKQLKGIHDKLENLKKALN